MLLPDPGMRKGLRPLSWLSWSDRTSRYGPSLGVLHLGVLGKQWLLCSSGRTVVSASTEDRLGRGRWPQPRLHTGHMGKSGKVAERLVGIWQSREVTCPL